MDDGKKVWVAHALDGYKLGRIVDLAADGVTVELLERPPGQKVSAPFNSTYPADEYDSKDVDDNCKQLVTQWLILHVVGRVQFVIRDSRS